VIPTVRLVWLAALGVPLCLLGLFSEVGLAWALGYNLLLVTAMIADRAATPDPAALAARRSISSRPVQGLPVTIDLALRWRGARRARLELREQLPPALSVSSDRHSVRLAPSGRATISYTAMAAERGTTELGSLIVRSSGPVGLLQRQTSIELAQTLRIYPDLISQAAPEGAPMQPSRWLVGQRRGALKGDGREFHQLRAYRAGDDIRQIDWKAFARRGHPIVREHRAERSQRVLLLIDAGRSMTVRIGDRLRFDWAAQAAGRLACAALSMGDLVGVAVYSRELKGRVPTARGAGQLAGIADLLCDAQPDLDEPNLGRALHGLLRGTHRRSLVVLFSEIADPRAAQQTIRHIGSLAPRHLALVVTLADTDLEAERHIDIDDADAVYRRLAADELWLESRKTVRDLESHGAQVVRARADALAAEAVERYIQIKTQGRL